MEAEGGCIKMLEWIKERTESREIIETIFPLPEFTQTMTFKFDRHDTTELENYLHHTQENLNPHFK